MTGAGLPTELTRSVGDRQGVQPLEYEEWAWGTVAVADVPGWAMGEVWYQIFPERFANGEQGNDPRGLGVYLAEWSGDWAGGCGSGERSPPHGRVPPGGG